MTFGIWHRADVRGVATVGGGLVATPTVHDTGPTTAPTAEDAVRRLDAEIVVTRRRLRALDKRWLPWLRQSLAVLELAIEQGEQEDGMRLRRAATAQDQRTAP